MFDQPYPSYLSPPVRPDIKPLSARSLAGREATTQCALLPMSGRLPGTLSRNDPAPFGELPASALLEGLTRNAVGGPLPDPENPIHGGF